MSGSGSLLFSLQHTLLLTAQRSGLEPSAADNKANARPNKWRNTHAEEYYSPVKKTASLSLATTRMDLEGITLSEMRHGKTKTIWFLLHMESKKRKINQPNKNRHNELMVAERAGVWGSGKKVAGLRSTNWHWQLQSRRCSVQHREHGRSHRNSRVRCQVGTRPTNGGETHSQSP